MAAKYGMVFWTPYKRHFDIVLGIGVAGFLAVHVVVTTLNWPPAQTGSEFQIGIRALGAAAYTLLHLILMIGPLARISPRFKPLLYNRRHLGVTCFLLALAHAACVMVWYHSFGTLNPFISILVSNQDYGRIHGFPFESLGLLGLIILFVLAATSHDFWNTNLGPRLWKTIHMALYPAFALIIAHVFLGAVQSDRGFILAGVVSAGAMLVAFVHGLASQFEVNRAQKMARDAQESWILVGPALEIADKCARIVATPKGERIAVFRDGQKVTAITNVCRHQAGPLGEGRIVDGCVTCPWHGFQYRPEDGCAPPPFKERLLVYRTRLIGRNVEVEIVPQPLGSVVAASLIPPDWFGEPAGQDSLPNRGTDELQESPSS